MRRAHLNCPNTTSIFIVWIWIVRRWEGTSVCEKFFAANVVGCRPVKRPKGVFCYSLYMMYQNDFVRQCGDNIYFRDSFSFLNIFDIIKSSIYQVIYIQVHVITDLKNSRLCIIIYERNRFFYVLLWYLNSVS